MTTNDVPFPSAANGVIAENIHGLHAHRAGGTFINHRKTKAIENSGAIVTGRQHSVVTIFARRDSSEEPVGVGLGTPRQALKLPVVGSRS